MDDKKIRRIILHKDEIFFDVDAQTYKMTEASLVEAGLRARNAISSDSGDSMDRPLLERMADTRDAELRLMLRFCIMPEHSHEECNANSNGNSYLYTLVLDRRFNDGTLKALATKMHEYIVQGCLIDWYEATGTPIAHDMETKLTETGSEITDMLRVPSFTRRPMQPFGPQENQWE